MNGFKRRVAACLSSLVFAALPGAVQSITVGEIHLQSHLNEPLAAEIALGDLGNTLPSDIVLEAADPAAYANAGMEIPVWLNSIQFYVENDPETGLPKIYLKTFQAITDPFVDLIVQVSWPDGKLVKGYTLLLDPPAKPTVTVRKKKSLRKPAVVSPSSEFHPQSGLSAVAVASQALEPPSGKRLQLVSQSSTASVMSPEILQRLVVVEQGIEALHKANEAMIEKNHLLEQQNATLMALMAQKEEEIQQLKKLIDKQFAAQKPKPVVAKPLVKTPENIIKAQPVKKHAESSYGTWALWLLVLLVGVGMVYRKYPELLALLKQRILAKKLTTSVEAPYGDNPTDMSSNLEKQLTRPIKEPLKRKTESVRKKTEKLSLQLEEKPETTSKTTPLIDPLIEIDAQIAYEHYGQAEKMLKEMLSKNPQQWEALLRLLEVYVSTEQYHDFEKIYDTLPKELLEKQPEIWSKIFSLSEKVKAEIFLSQGEEQLLLLEDEEEKSTLPVPKVKSVSRKK